MTLTTIGRVLLVGLAVVGLAFATPAVSAHGDGPVSGGTPLADGTADEWTAWMESHMTQQMGPGAVEWMESHMGVTIDEMGQFMAGGTHRGPGVSSRGGMYGGGGTTGNGGMYGAGHGC